MAFCRGTKAFDGPDRKPRVPFSDLSDVEMVRHPSGSSNIRLAPVLGKLLGIDCARIGLIAQRRR